MLAKPANEITASDIMAAFHMADHYKKLEIESVSSVESPTGIAMNTFWEQMAGRITGLYHQVSLQDVIDGNLAPMGPHEETTLQAAE